MTKEEMRTVCDNEINRLNKDLKFFISNRHIYPLRNIILICIKRKRSMLELIKFYPNKQEKYLRVNNVISKAIYEYYEKHKPKPKDLFKEFNISKTIGYDIIKNKGNYPKVG